MKLQVNGEWKDFESVQTLEDVLRALGIDRARIATELNLSIVPKANYATARLKDGDRIEIVSFVGGG